MLETRSQRATAVLDSDVAATPPHPTLLCALDAAADANLPLLTVHGARGRIEAELTFRQLRERARDYARLLHAHGVRRGDRVLLLLPTSSAFVEAMLGTMLASAVPVPLAGSLTFGGAERYLENLLSIAQAADARVILTSERMRDAIGGSDELRAFLTHALTPQALDGLGPRTAHPPASISGDDTALLQFTSGTTGRPKGATISQRALVSNAFSIARGLQIDASSVGVSWLPLFHDMGLIGVLLTAIAHPYPIHLMPPEHFVMHPRGWLELMSRVRGTLSAAPNFAYERCLSRGVELAPEVDLSCVRTLLNGAEPVHASTLARFTSGFARHGLRDDVMLPVYGLAEATLAVTFPALRAAPQVLHADRDALERRGVFEASTADAARALVSTGRPVAGMRVGIFDGAGHVRADGEVGEIRVQGPSLMDGYFRNEEASAEAFADGYLCTGDLGLIHDGQLYVTGRKKDLIIKSGRNVHPYDIERIAESVSGLRAGGTAAFARPNAETGTDDLVLAAETLETDPEARARIVREARGEVLAVLGVKIDRVHFCRIGRLPRTTSGKLRRKACAELFEETEA
jgi:fatty-acyl-CoA synthase